MGEEEQMAHVGDCWMRGGLDLEDLAWATASGMAGVLPDWMCMEAVRWPWGWAGPAERAMRPVSAVQWSD